MSRGNMYSDFARQNKVGQTEGPVFYPLARFQMATADRHTGEGFRGRLWPTFVCSPSEIRRTSEGPKGKPMPVRIYGQLMIAAFDAACTTVAGVLHTIQEWKRSKR